MSREYGHLIQYYRKLSGLSQRELGTSLGVTDRCISSWEVGRTEPDMKTIHKIASVLGCSISDLMPGTETSNENEELIELCQLYTKADDITKRMVMKLLSCK